MLLEVSNLTVCYDKATIVSNLSMGVEEKEMVSLVGPNGAGKSTLLRAITGLVAWEKEMKRGTTGGDVTLEGTIVFDGQRIENTPAHKIVEKGLIHCPERRRPFRELTVNENLMAGGYLVKDRAELRENLENVYRLFPQLRERGSQVSGTMSGGEQQMLSIGRTLMSNPRLLLLDEPVVGLAPIVKQKIYEAIKKIRQEGTTTLLVTQDIYFAMYVADIIHVLENGNIKIKGTKEELEKEPRIRKIYLGI